ncbi:MAG: hypothetical protein NW218_19365 [Saprospiraceae bacterium]|nr:hypothetical protein [Saprospiraceae bacterium]
MAFISNLKNNLKNIAGWNTKRKLLAFAVDDYGNVRLKNIEAREKLKSKGVKLQGRFDYLDAMDTREDFEHLFEVLSSVKDWKGAPAIFTPYALSCNTNYETTLMSGKYVPENLDYTYERLSLEDPVAYVGTYKLLKQGIQEKLIRPQFHGREHLNVHLFNALLKEKDPSLLSNLELHSMAGVSNHRDFPNVTFNEAFAFWIEEEVALHKEVIADGLQQFKHVYGYPSLTFTPPAQQLHPSLYSFVIDQGLIGVDKVRATKRHLGQGHYVSEQNVMGVSKRSNFVTIVRNCVFEPNEGDINWLNFTFNQIKAAFFWNKPAIVSSHRVNFCGHIDPKNRQKGLNTLKLLLQKVTKTWPDVEFIAIDDLAQLIKNDA